MATEVVVENYKHGRLIEAIKEGLSKMNLSPDQVTIETLGPVDEFHIGGRLATTHFIEQLHFRKDARILDLGCGLGGAARFVAHTFGCHVEGVDLCAEYVETGKTLNNWVKLQNQVHLVQGSVLDLPFADGSFDGAYQLHVGMNIENKERLFAEVRRVLKPGATFGIFDIMATGHGELQYPVPWASSPAISHLATLAQYTAALEKSGFKIVATEDRKEFALDFFKRMKAKTQEAGGPAPLGFHTLMQQTTAAKLQNMVAGVANDIVVPVELVSQAR